MRHYLNLRIIWAVLTTFRTIGPFELNWETQQYKCWISQYITAALLSALQAINLFWLFLILRIAKNYVFSSVRKDERSEDEEEEEEEQEREVNEGQGPSLATGVVGNGDAANGGVKRRAAQGNGASK